jgi:hypothetical protein
VPLSSHICRTMCRGPSKIYGPLAKMRPLRVSARRRLYREQQRGEAAERHCEPLRLTRCGPIDKSIRARLGGLFAWSLLRHHSYFCFCP